MKKIDYGKFVFNLLLVCWGLLALLMVSICIIIDLSTQK